MYTILILAVLGGLLTFITRKSDSFSSRGGFASTVIDLAAKFHRFYNSCRIKGEEEAVLKARLKLADSVRSVIATSLAIVGVTAPEKM